MYVVLTTLRRTDAKFVRQPQTSLLKRPSFVLHREADDITALAAAETMAIVLARALYYGQRRVMVFVPGTEGDVVHACLAHMVAQPPQCFS